MRPLLTIHDGMRVEDARDLLASVQDTNPTAVVVGAWTVGVAEPDDESRIEVRPPRLVFGPDVDPDHVHNLLSEALAHARPMLVPDPGAADPGPPDVEEELPRHPYQGRLACTLCEEPFIGEQGLRGHLARGHNLKGAGREVVRRRRELIEEAISRVGLRDDEPEPPQPAEPEPDPDPEPDSVEREAGTDELPDVEVEEAEPVAPGQERVMEEARRSQAAAAAPVTPPTPIPPTPFDPDRARAGAAKAATGEW